MAHSIAPLQCTTPRQVGGGGLLVSTAAGPNAASDAPLPSVHRHLSPLLQESGGKNKLLFGGPPLCGWGERTGVTKQDNFITDHNLISIQYYLAHGFN